jgi:hypothetical protein
MALKHGDLRVIAILSVLQGEDIEDIALALAAIQPPAVEFTQAKGGVAGHLPGNIGDLEIVAKPESIHIHISDQGKAVKLDGAKAKVTLLNGAEKSEADLVLVGDKLEAKGAYKVAKGTKGVAIVTLAGKSPVTARFDIK